MVEETRSRKTTRNKVSRAGSERKDAMGVAISLLAFFVLCPSSLSFHLTKLLS